MTAKRVGPSHTCGVTACVPRSQVVRIDACGITYRQDLKRRELLRQTGLPARDLRRVTPIWIRDTALRARCRCRTHYSQFRFYRLLTLLLPVQAD